ncbi:glycoside hydrolase family 93 protein [Zopfia rhizophila CBS 207.26]|uniref:Glycoside hydrolase family 93 protein n=1 Tax=Zopfia rhizophila CBS 207.26 TaxID=1314779 RepID=A0A6A6E6H0_9PEZI|nr:glycoside hydrolase family 93 protein [Zopfia rhizophila CBS 207.26]
MRLLQPLLYSIGLFSTLTNAQAPSKSGDPVVMATSGTYPRATRLSDGSLLGVYTHFNSGNHTITTLKSTDNGASWSVLGTVNTGPESTKDIDNPFVHQLPNGRILCAFRNHDKAVGSQPRFYRITVCVSDDNGATWKYLSTPASDSNSANGNWEPFLINALDGSLQLYYSRENAGSDQDSLLRRSTDGGATWTSAQTISGADITARDGMLGLTRTSPNSPTLLAVFESKNTTGNNLYTIHTISSPDDGQTWGSRNLVYSSLGHNAGAPGLIRVGNKLVTSFGTDEDGGTWPTGAMKVVVSSDGGRTWGDKTTIHAQPAQWSGMLAIDDRRFLAMYESENTIYAQRMVL